MGEEMTGIPESFKLNRLIIWQPYYNNKAWMSPIIPGYQSITMKINQM